MAMAHITFADAAKLIDQFQRQRNSAVGKKDRAAILKVELRFLKTFLLYTVIRCPDEENLRGLVTSVEGLEHRVEYVIQVLALWEELPDLEYAVDDVVDEIQLVKPEIIRVQMQVSRVSGRGGRMSDEFVFEFLDSLLADLKELVGCDAGLIQPSLKEGVKLLKTKLTHLKGLLPFTAKRFHDLDILNQLFTLVQATADAAAYLAYSCLTNTMDAEDMALTHLKDLLTFTAKPFHDLDKLNQPFTLVQATADTAAYLAYSCLTNKMDAEDMGSGLAPQLSHLVHRIDPEVREIYVGVLGASKSSETKSDTYEMDETLVDIVNSLLENTVELLYRDDITVKGQIEMLYEELKSFRYLLKDAERLTEHANSNDLLAKMEVFAIYSGSVIYSLFQDEVNQEMSLPLSQLLDNFKPVPRLSNHPTTDVLGTLGLLLRDLKELLDASDDSINLLKDYLQIVFRDMAFLGSFLTKIKEQRDEHEKLLWRRIINVMYEVEYVIDLVVIKDGSVSHHKSWLSYLIEEIRLIKIAISEIQISEKNICSLQEHNVSRVLSQEGALRIDEEMVGFEDEEEELMEQLVGESVQLQIVSIVGMAGLGKTFLAQKIYNNSTIKNHFDVHAWSSVSQVYQRKELLINFLSKLEKFTEKLSEMTDEELAGGLYRCLKGQRYLIVLDDVWDIEAWEALRRSFPDDENGSRIVFTSRFAELASQAKSGSKIHRLRSFSDSESWELLKKKIFQKETCPSELLDVGQHIAKRCNGLPLAVVVVAGLLGRTVEELDRWRDIANRLSSFIITDPQRQCMDILDLSYKRLPDYLKPCFLYLGTFPEDKEIPVKKLIWLWIAEGFVQDKEPNSEDVAEGYLMDLINKSLVIASKKRSTNGVKTCILHDLVREFCLAKAKEENFFMLMEGSDDLPNVPISYGRRLLVHLKEGKLNWSKSFRPYVRSLLCVNQLVYIKPGNIQRLGLLRVLHLLNVLLEQFPEGMESLVLLRYLAVRIRHGVVAPPQSIASLRRLETLIIDGGDGTSFGDIFLNLTKLRHIHVSYLRLSHVSCFDESFRLDTLQTLSKLYLSDDSNVDIMRRFPNLKKLSFFFLDPSSECNRLPTLDFLSHLESLKLYYITVRSLSQQTWDGFSLPSNIRKLTLTLFPLPWEQISIIAKLPNLEVLKLLSCAIEGEQWTMQEGDFEKLKVLKLWNLDIRTWIASGDSFPRLERLILEKCDRLEEIPSSLEDTHTLKVIRVYQCNASLETSIKQIQEQHREYGNELEIEIKQ